MKRSYRIEKFEDVAVFRERMKNFDPNTIECTEHTFFRLSEGQRKIFRCDDLKSVLLNDIPLRIGIQYDRKYAIYYNYQGRVLKMLLSLSPNKIRIVTFWLINRNQLPG